MRAVWATYPEDWEVVVDTRSLEGVRKDRYLSRCGDIYDRVRGSRASHNLKRDTGKHEKLTGVCFETVHLSFVARP